jgi:hypothetical protein
LVSDADGGAATGLHAVRGPRGVEIAQRWLIVGGVRAA